MLGEAIAVRADIPAGLADGRGSLRVALERQCTGVDRERQSALPKHVVEAPEARSPAILEHRFRRQIARSHTLIGPACVGQGGFRAGVAVENVDLGALL